MNWSVRPDKRFRLALGSFIEEYNNKVQIISLDEETSEFSAKRYGNHMKDSDPTIEFCLT